MATSGADNEIYDAIIVGSGPAGASCAAFGAAAGLRVLLLERARFPREKVCGDCLNPDCWPVLTRLGVDESLRELPHVRLREVEFVGARGQRVRFPLPATHGTSGEITMKRSLLDAHLLARAAGLGAEIVQEAAVTGMRRENGGFAVDFAGARAGTVRARTVVAADGRNSLIARLAGLLPRPSPNGSNGTAPGGFPSRVGLQTHAPSCPPEFAEAGLVQMRWFPGGGHAYGGIAPVSDNTELNISLVGAPGRLEDLKAWAQAEFSLPAGWPEWRTIAPLDRAPARPPASAEGVFLVGDAARVVEPFTGEGIYYALRSGELAAAAIVRATRGGQATARAAADYGAAHRRIYRERGRLWVNRLARAAVLHPRLADWVLALAQRRPGILRLLTAKVVR